MSFHRVWMYEEIMTNDDDLEFNLLTSNLLKIRSQHPEVFAPYSIRLKYREILQDLRIVTKT